MSLWLFNVGCSGGSAGTPNGSGGTTPNITNLNPTAGHVGTAVTIAGTNFGASQGTSTIKFNGVAAAPTSWSATSIVAPVPTGATTGNVVVTVGGVASSGMAFTVTTTASAPSITSLNPTSGVAGTQVTIAGTNFGASQSTSTIKFNGIAAAPTSWSATSIVAPVPTGATTGNVVVTVGGVASNGMAFTVTTTSSAPSIASLNPTSGVAGTQVTIAGTNFGSSQGSSTITFSGIAAAPTSWSATSIVAPVPAGATTGNVVVTVGGVASNGVAFTVTTASAPSITSLNPTSGVVGTVVTIAGTNFGASQGTSTIKFNGIAAAPTSWSATSIVAPVPTGAATGNVVVTVGGTSSNGMLFTVSTVAAKWPIKISANKRYFVDQTGTPWMMVADAAHHLMPAIPQSSVAQYLNDRVANGFNTINFYGACAGSGTCPASGAAFNGVRPFLVGTSNATYDLSTPDPAYWSQVDSVITQAANLGLVVLFEPLPWGVNFGTAMENTTGPINYPTNDFNFGVFLGNRYKNFPNIIWQFGQDFRGSALPSPTFMDYMAQVMAGVASVDTNHLITCQLNYYRSYSQQGIPIGNSSYNSTLNTSFAYTYYETYDYVLAAYNASPTMPVFLGESNYETANNTGQLSSNADAFITRLEMWWTMTSGGAGHEFGNEHVNHFDSTSPTWQSQLDTAATLQVKYLSNLLNQFQWWMLVPDQSHQVVTAGYGTYSTTNENLYNASYATTAWNTNGTLAITYTPVSTTLSVNMANFSKPMNASWYDPTTGTSTAINGSPFATSGSQSFTTPSIAHSDGTHDWVLVLQ